MDWERFEAEFADLDAELDAGSSLADRVLAVVHARRARRRLVAVVAGATLAAGVLVSVLLVVLPGQATSGPAAAGAADTATRAYIYAAALNGELHGAAATSRVPSFHGAAAAGGAAEPQYLAGQQIWVSTRVCPAAWANSTATSCAGGHIPHAVQRQVSALLGPRVHFSATPPAPGAGVRVVQFGRLVVHGKHAELGIGIRCGPGCGGWQSLLLRKTAGHWQVSGPP